MTTSNHPIEHEELMAYLDGELETERAAEAVAHLERCPECRRLAADLKSVSVTMREWEVGPAPADMKAIDAALEGWAKQNDNSNSEAPSTSLLGLNRKVKPAGKLQFKKWAGPRRVMFASFAVAGTLAAALVVGVFVMNQNPWNVEMAKRAAPYEALVTPSNNQSGAPLHQRSAATTSFTAPSAGNAVQLYSSDAALGSNKQMARLQEQIKIPSHAANFGPSGNASTVGGTLPRSRFDLSAIRDGEVMDGSPMVIHNASLTLTTKDFDKSRDALDATLRRHGGYIGQLNTSGTAGSGRSLTAQLRVPAGQLEDVINDVKQTARVDAESQNGEEVTQQYVDLEARIENARNARQRMTDILRERTGRLSDVLEVEEQIDSISGQIEQMEAERKSLAKQAALATLSITMNEEYKAPIQQAVPGSTSTRLGNAVVDGFKIVADAILGFVLFLLTYGPILLLWTAILFFPVRALWRRIRKLLKANEASNT